MSTPVGRYNSPAKGHSDEMFRGSKDAGRFGVRDRIGVVLTVLRFTEIKFYRKGVRLGNLKVTMAGTFAQDDVLSLI